MKTELELFVSEDVELVIDTVTGESYVTKRGYSRLADLPITTLHDRIKRDALSFSYGKVVKAGKTRNVMLIPETVIAKWLADDNPEMLSKFAQMGIRLALHHLAGFHYVPRQDNPVAPNNMETLIDGLIAWRARVKGYAEDKPKSLIDNVVTNSQPALPGMLTLREMLPDWDDLSKGDKSKYGRLVSDTYKWTYGKAPHTKRLMVETATGKLVSRKYNCYPTEFKPQIESILKNN